jgi:hypothetical protein
MKSKFFMVALAAAMIFSACSKEEAIDNNSTNLTVKVEAASSRAIQSPGTTNAITLSGGVIFLITPDGSVSSATALIPTQIQGAGQVFSNVPSSSRVFIVANPTAAAQTALLAATSFIQIQEITEDALGYQTTLYSNVALSNSTGNPASITVISPTAATVNITISPVIARLELAGITGGTFIETSGSPAVPTGNQTRITGFDVIGVFVDAYAPNFTYTGGSQGTLVNINQTQVGTPGAAWTGIQDIGTWTATGTPTVAGPGTGQVWGYNVPAAQLSRLVIAVDNVTFEVSSDNGATWTDATCTNYNGIHYITVGGYNVPSLGTNPVTELLRGYIYTISAEGMTFNTGNLHPTPNPVEVGLTVNVTIQNWILAPSNPILE